MYPRLFDWLPITNYGFLVAAGFLLALGLTLRLARKAGEERAMVMDVAIWGLLWGLLGAKATLVIVNLPDYVREPGALVGVLRYAGVFYGGFFTAILFIVYYSRRHKIGFFRITDLFAPGLALAHAFGRTGCFLAGCCWGGRCELPWAVTFTSEEANSAVGTPLHLPLHPVQLYEAAGNLLICLLLVLLLRRGLRAGIVTGLYVLLYACSRFGWEFLRGDPRGEWGPLSTSQWFALAAALAALAALAVAWSRSRRAPGAEETPEEAD
jgi:phosphatidylglycerol:prolipoprotein diacylglycerol transferase